MKGGCYELDSSIVNSIIGEPGSGNGFCNHMLAGRCRQRFFWIESTTSSSCRFICPGIQMNVTSVAIQENEYLKRRRILRRCETWNDFEA